MDSFWPLGPNPPAYLPELSVSVRSSANPGVHCRAPESTGLLILTPSYAPWMLPSPLPLRRQALWEGVPHLCLFSHYPQA